MTDVAGKKTHALLEDAHRIVADRSCAALSFDIFDTILWRRVPRPADVFGIIGARLRAAGLAPAWLTDATFRRMRIDAERKARRDHGDLGPEVSLFDIWRAMPAGTFDKALLEKLVALEMEVEREFTVVDLDIAELIAAAHRNKVPLVLVSDTYFTEEQLAYLLDRPELEALKSAKVYRSHQHGLDKTNGLFEIALNDLGLTPEQVVHIGDNEVADIETGIEIGMRVVHYRRIDQPLAVVLEREGEPEDGFGDYAPNLDDQHGDFGITSLRAKALQASGADSESGTDIAWRYGAAVLGPVLTGFAEWVAWRAHEDGTKVLWCPMREGELLSALINNAAQARGWAVQAKPVWLSRHVTSLAALDSFDADSVQEFIRRSHKLTVRELLSVLHLRTGDVPALANELNSVVDNGDIAQRVAVALTESPHLQNRLKATITATRERMVLHLRTVGALDAPEMTMVDLGWGGTIQRQLAAALKVAGIKVKPAGLYLATDDRSARAYAQGLRLEGYLAQAGNPADVCGAIVRSPEVLEQCVNALCGSLVGFNEDGSPVLGRVSESTTQNNERLAAQQGMLAFQRLWNDYVHASGGAWPTLARPQAAKDRLANILVSALRAPTPGEAAVFGSWVHEDNFGSTVVTRLIPDDLVAALPYLSPLDLEDLGMRDSFWPALLASGDTGLAAAGTALASGQVVRDVFEASGEPAQTKLWYKTGANDWELGGERRVRINRNGLSFARMYFEHHDTHDLSLLIPGRPAIVRVDWIEVRGNAGRRPLDHPLRYETPDDFMAMTYRDARWLGANLVEFFGPESAIILRVRDQLGMPMSSGQVTVAFAMLPQSMSNLSAAPPSTASRVQRISGRLRAEYRFGGAKGVATSAARVAIRKLGGAS
ncbi:HAD family hydrolase [Kibdelosporangium philippinense]|uniref:HAD family hydrolase n=1 Tax=Kibdelosporangium philippinense TaxID=211113 RepID=A0ABS8ZM76_9PSEU|nr:HAD family hydrolase [Kibdelosporangium philippinense]MCE7008864.1 HAD family hydrolase [Kibdelosporangium philippinense]